MFNYKLLILVILALLLGACTVTGPADDGFENTNEWIDNGRLLSDDNSGYTVYSSKRIPANVLPAKTEAEPPSKDELNIAAYRQWLNAKQKNPPESRKLQQWQEFEAFQRCKEQVEYAGAPAVLAKWAFASDP